MALRNCLQVQQFCSYIFVIKSEIVTSLNSLYAQIIMKTFQEYALKQPKHFHYFIMAQENWKPEKS